MCFWLALVIRNAPRRCTPSTVSQSSSDILNSRLSRSTPALFTSTAGGPSSAATRSTAAVTWSVLLTSAPTAIACPPASPIALTVPAQLSSSRSITATAIPSAASRIAVAAPMPRAAPVTMAIRCWSCGICFLLVVTGRARRQLIWVGPVSSVRADRRWSARFGGVLAQLPAGQGPLVHLVRPVREPQRPGAHPQLSEREVLADPAGAVRLDRLVDHPLGH